MIVFDMGKEQIGTSNEAVIGIYYPNGVFFEAEGEQGISYILDHIIYEELQKSIGDLKHGHVQGFTYYGYTGYHIKCPSNKVKENLGRIEKILYEQIWHDDDLIRWIEFRQKASHCKPIPIENQYYSKRVINGPLVKTLSAGINCIPTHESIQTWRRAFITPERVVCFVTGDNPEEIATDDKMPLAESCLPSCSTNEIACFKHIPWRRTNMIYAVPYSMTKTNVLASEACCQMIRAKVASRINSMGGQLFSVQFCPDYVPELRIQAQMQRGTEMRIANELDRALKAEEELSQKQIQKLRSKVKSSYDRLHKDPVAWNRLAGYNVMSGNRYNLAGLCDAYTYEEQITLTSVSNVLSTIKCKEKRNVFVTAVR